jgi:hypothetical protein
MSSIKDNNPRIMHVQDMETISDMLNLNAMIASDINLPGAAEALAKNCIAVRDWVDSHRKMRHGEFLAIAAKMEVV